jgi:uncharacterized coiled-coil DUF342 family protein
MNARDEIQKRREGWERSLSSLAYQRLQKTREIDEIDEKISGLEGAIQAARAALADMDTEAAIAAAKTNETTPKETT